MIVVDTSALAIRESDSDTNRYGQPLTPRQCEILGLLAAGHQPKVIEHLIGINHSNLWNHIKGAKVRIGAGTTTRAVVLFALAGGAKRERA